MAFLPYDELVNLIDAIANSLQSRGEFVVSDVFGGDHPMKALTFTNPDAFALLRCRRPGQPNGWTRIQIAGGGGVGARPEPSLFQHLLLRGNEFDWGGPFAADQPNGTITYGSQLVIPSTLVNQSDPREAASFIIDMIGVMGRAARTVATEALPHVGGSLLNGSDPKHGTLLFAALLGPMPPDIASQM
jgi:hypothetical protein